jgi:hypothetical protein
MIGGVVARPDTTQGLVVRYVRWCNLLPCEHPNVRGLYTNAIW